MRESSKETDAKTVRLLMIAGFFLEFVVREIVGTLAHYMGQHRGLSEVHHRSTSALEHIKEDVGGTLCCAIHINVRVGLVTRQNVAVGYHHFGHVRMHIKGHADWQLWMLSPNAPQELALTIVECFGCHCPVEIEQEGIDRPS
jgi:hypothetical protein